MFNIVTQYQYVQAPLRSMVMRSWCVRMDGILALLADKNYAFIIRLPNLTVLYYSF